MQRTGVGALVIAVSAACRPAIIEIELPIVHGTASAILSNGSQLLAFEPESARMDGSLDGFASEATGELELAVYRCSLEELGLAAGRIEVISSGAPLPETSCVFRHAPRPASVAGAEKTGAWRLESGLSPQLSALRVARGDEACFPARRNPECREEAGTIRLAPPRTSLGAIGAGRVTVERPEVESPYLRFGSSVEISGDLIAVAAFGDDSCALGIDGDERNTGCSDAGSVHVFRWTPEGWQKDAYLKASNTHAEQEFGVDLALEGNILLVGARRDAACTPGGAPGLGCTSRGAVFAFRREPTGWVQEAILVSPSPRLSDWFGTSVALSNGVALIGAPGQDSCGLGVDAPEGDLGCTNRGAVHVFDRAPSGRWNHAAVLRSSSAEAHVHAGTRLAWSNGLALVGATSVALCRKSAEEAEPPSDCSGAGGALAFERDPVTGAWSELGPLPLPRASVDLGSLPSLAVGPEQIFVAEGQGSTCRNAPPAGCFSAGSVRVLRPETGAWTLDAELSAQTSTGWSGFGHSMAHSQDVLLVSAPLSSGHGLVRAFRRTPDGWQLESDLEPAMTSARATFFGDSVALFDGYAVVGASGVDGCNAASNPGPACSASGAVFVFEPPEP